MGAAAVVAEATLKPCHDAGSGVVRFDLVEAQGVGRVVGAEHELVVRRHDARLGRGRREDGEAGAVEVAGAGEFRQIDGDEFAVGRTLFVDFREIESRRDGREQGSGLGVDGLPSRHAGARAEAREFPRRRGKAAGFGDDAALVLTLSFDCPVTELVERQEVICVERFGREAVRREGSAQHCELILMMVQVEQRAGKRVVAEIEVINFVYRRAGAAGSLQSRRAVDQVRGELFQHLDRRQAVTPEQPLSREREAVRALRHRPLQRTDQIAWAARRRQRERGEAVRLVARRPGQRRGLAGKESRREQN